MAKMTELELAGRNMQIRSRRAANAALGKGDNIKLLLHTPESGHVIVCEPEVSESYGYCTMNDGEAVFCLQGEGPMDGSERLVILYSIKWRLTIYKHTHTSRGVTEQCVYHHCDRNTLADAVAEAREWVLNNCGSDELQTETHAGLFQAYTKH